MRNWRGLGEIHQEFKDFICALVWISFIRVFFCQFCSAAEIQVSRPAVLCVDLNHKLPPYG